MVPIYGNHIENIDDNSVGFKYDMVVDSQNNDDNSMNPNNNKDKINCRETDQDEPNTVSADVDSMIVKITIISIIVITFIALVRILVMRMIMRIIIMLKQMMIVILLTQLV